MLEYSCNYTFKTGLKTQTSRTKASYPLEKNLATSLPLIHMKKDCSFWFEFSASVENNLFLPKSNKSGKFETFEDKNVQVF